MKARSARAQGVLQLLAPRAPVLVLQPPPPRLKRKKQSIMGNGVLHSKHQKRAKPTPPSPSIPGLVGEKPRGRGVLFSLHVHPLCLRTPPRSSGSLKVSDGGERPPPPLPARSPLPLNCALLLCFSQVPPALSPPPPRPLPPGSQLSPLPAAPTEVPASARARPSQVARAETPRRPGRSGRPRDTPPERCGGRGERSLPPSPGRKRSRQTRPGHSSGPRAHASPERPRPDGAGHWPGGHHLRSAPSPRPSVRSYIPGKSPPLRL